MLFSLNKDRGMMKSMPDHGSPTEPLPPRNESHPRRRASSIPMPQGAREMRKLQQGILTALALAALLPAQTVSTEILGLVTDNSGAVLPNATVRARRIATGDVRTTKSNDTGNYVFPLLEIGDYEVTCLATGFRTE